MTKDQIAEKVAVRIMTPDDTKRLVKDSFERLRNILTKRSAGEYDTWGFVAMFMEMIDQAEREAIDSAMKNSD